MCRSFGKSGRSSMAELQPSKLATRVRFPSPAPECKPCQGGVMAAAADSKSAIREYVRVRVPLLAPDERTATERCPSGLKYRLGKAAWGQLHRGFESPPLRQFRRKALRTEVLGVFLLPEFPLRRVHRDIYAEANVSLIGLGKNLAPTSRTTHHVPPGMRGCTFGDAASSRVKCANKG